MPTPSTAHLPPPKSWDEFEDICADLFSVEWGDRNAARYGRQGQGQNGVDIYGHLSNGDLAGVQCKGKRAWPPKPFKTDDIDIEVAEAKKFKPPLTEFTIATTAPDDAKLQDHARAITERHKKKGLFSVHVVGWGELSRRLTQHDHLVEKHYGFVALTSLRKEIRDVPHATANIVVERLREIGIAASGPTLAIPQAALRDVNALQAGFTAALERDLEHRYNKVLHRSLFPEVSKIDGFHLLAKEVLEGEFFSVSEALHRRIFLRAARSTALRGELDEAERFLAAATALVGLDTDLPARARLAEGRGDVDGAIRLLRDAKDADARSTLFNILTRHRGDAAALAWLAEHNLSVPDLTVNGIHTLAMIHLQHDDFQKTRDILIEATDAQLAEGPYFLFLRAAVRLATLFPKPDQRLPLMGVPLDVRSGHTILAGEIVTAELDAAIADLNQFLSIASELGLREARHIAEAYIIWCHLLHPVHRNAAVARLRADMADPVTALPRLQFAFAHDSEFDPTPITRYLENREQLGGLDEEELRAALVLRLHSDEPREIADFIARHRTRLEAVFGKAGIVSIEIQALALAKDATSARLALDQNRDLIDSNLTRLLEAEIAKADGSDPVAEHKRAYEATKSPEALRALVGELVRRKDHRAVAHYAEDLYAQTNDPRDAVVTANALASAGDDAGFLRVVDAYPFVKEHNPALARHQARKLFGLGRISQAKQIAEELRASHEAKYRDLDLEIAIALESGDWEALAIPLSAYLENAADHSGLALIRAAKLSQASGQGPFAGLMNAAVERAPEDPSVLIGAYSMVIEEGLEERRPEANAWFRSALDLSGPDGPVKRFELKELLSRQVAWNERTREINDAVVKGDLPLIFAAPGLRTTLVDVVLRNLFRNVTLSDPRKRTALPLFSGRRRPSSIEDVSRLAIDQSALIVLAWLGLLPKVIQTYSKIVLPASALQELFQGRSRIRQFQKSRIERARDIQSAIARGGRRLKVPFRDSLVPISQHSRSTCPYSSVGARDRHREGGADCGGHPGSSTATGRVDRTLGGEPAPRLGCGRPDHHDGKHGFAN